MKEGHRKPNQGVQRRRQERLFPLKITMKQEKGKEVTFSTPKEAFDSLTMETRGKYIHLLEEKTKEIQSAVIQASTKLNTVKTIKGYEEEGVVEIMQSLIDMQVIKIRWMGHGKRKYMPVDKTIIGTEEIADQANETIAEIVEEKEGKANKIQETLSDGKLLEDLAKVKDEIIENAQATVRSRKAIDELLKPFIEAGVIRRKKQGRKTFYVSNDLKNEKLIGITQEINKKCDEIDAGIMAKAIEYDEIAKNGFEEIVKKGGKEVAKFACQINVEKIPGTTQKVITIEKLAIKFGHRFVTIQEGATYISTNNQTPQFLRNALIRMEASEIKERNNKKPVSSISPVSLVPSEDKVTEAKTNGKGKKSAAA